ncbi:MAG: helix-turn-helix transcriptional regulator [Bacteroidales bacterium]
MEKTNEINSVRKVDEFIIENNEINHNNFPMAICWLIQEVKALRDLLQHQQTPQVIVNDRISLDEACKLTGYGKSKIYKLTYSDGIPHKLMGNRLVFSRSELLSWLETNTVNRQPKSKNVLSSIATSAANKTRR